MSEYSDRLLAASRATVDGVDPGKVEPSLRAEVGALLGLEATDDDTIEFATYLASGILSDQTRRVLMVQLSNEKEPDIMKAGDTAAAVVFLTGVATGIKLVEQQERPA